MAHPREPRDARRLRGSGVGPGIRSAHGRPTVLAPGVRRAGAAAVAPPRVARCSSEQFAVAVGLAARVQRTVEGEMATTTRRVLHRLNLPAGTDVSRILNEIGQLRVQVRELSAELDDARAELAGRPPAPSRRSASDRQEAGAGARSGRPSGRGRPDAGRACRPPSWSSACAARRRAQRAAGPQRAQAPRRRRPARADADAEGDRLVGREGRAVALPQRPRARYRTPLLFVHSLVSRSYVFDLVPGNSFVEAMIDRGFDVYLVDWGVPDELESGNTLETYTDGYIPTIIARGAAAVRRPGRQRVRLLLRRRAVAAVAWPATRRCPCAAWP